MAPEIVNKQEYYAKPVDIWSLGVLLYVFLNGRFPFRGKTDQELFSSIRCGVFRISSEITLTAQRLINHMLKVKPNERFTIK